MQRTEKYFEPDAFRTQCESVILAAEPDEKTGGGRIALDGTVFYPEGGGQPADRGTLTLPDGTTLNVTDVHERDGILWHSVDALPESAVPGTAVSGCIDWEWRFDKMQQHTGEHILSGILHQMFGAENVGFHIGSEAVRMDTSVPISAEGLQAAELAANRIVWQDVPVLVSYPTREELAALVYRSKKEIEGQVRIVTIPGCGRLRLLRHPHPHHRSGGADQNSGIRELQGRRAAERGVRSPCAGSGTGHACPAGRHRGAALGQGRPDRCGGASRLRRVYCAQVYTLWRMFSAVRCTCPAGRPR